MHPLPLENVDGTRERRRDRRDEDGVAPVLELLDDEPRDKGIFDLDQRGPPRALAASPRYLLREAADDPIARDSLEDGPFEPVPSPPSDASTDGGADDGADRENEEQRQELFGGNPLGEKRGERPTASGLAVGVARGFGSNQSVAKKRGDGFGEPAGSGCLDHGEGQGARTGDGD